MPLECRDSCPHAVSLVTVYYLAPRSPLSFPDPALADSEGLLAVGGDLGIDRLLLAYRLGIFPWYSESDLPLWWSPDPRAVLDPDLLHVSRSLLRRLEHGRFEVTWNRAFETVIEECRRERSDGTWILDEVKEAYIELHRLGHAHSLEVWEDGKLTGGIYGVQIGGLFAAESKFYRKRDASKIALVACVRSLFAAGIELFDVQFQTTHLARLGVTELSRDSYLARLVSAVEKRVGLEDLEPDWRRAPPGSGPLQP